MSGWLDSIGWYTDTVEPVGPRGQIYFARREELTWRTRLHYKQLIALVVALSSMLAKAELVTVTQTFKDVSWDNYAVASGLGYGQTVTGDWIFTGTVDTLAINQYGWPADGASYLATVTLTQSSLGLTNVLLSNAGYIYFYSDQIGFAFNTDGGSPWTRTKYADTQFSSFSAFPLPVGRALPLSTHIWNGFGPQWEGFALPNGLRIYGMGFASASSVSVQNALPIPEPSKLAFFLLGLGAVALSVRWRMSPAE